MLRVPTFKRHYRVEILDGDGVLLLSEDGARLLRGALCEQIAPLLDGNHTTDEIADRLDSVHGAAEVYYTIMNMEDAGCLVEACDGIEQSRAAFWHSMDVDPSAAALRLAAVTMDVRAVGDVPIDLCAKKLEQYGLCSNDPADITVVLADDYCREELSQYNDEALRLNRPWVLARPVGRVVWIGPLFVPGESGCWKCLEHFLSWNRPWESYLQREETRLELPSPAYVRPTLDVGLSILATQLYRLIGASSNSHLVGSIVSCDTTDLQIQRHTFVRRPQCGACGDLALYSIQASRPLVLTSQQKKSVSDGGHRVLSPEETLSNWDHLVDPVTGVGHTMRRLDVDEGGLIRVYVSGSNGRWVCSAPGLSRSILRRGGGGKGVSDAQARASALGETIERYSGVFQGDEPRIQATFGTLSDRAIHPNRCMNYSDTQYRTRDEWNRRYPGRHSVPAPFDISTPIEWSPVWSLTESRTKYLPTAYLYYGYPILCGEWFCRADSNGNAAGNTREEAVLQGFLELVERDAVALWWYNRVQRPAVDLARIEDAYLEGLVQYLLYLDRQLWVLDVTNDIGVPCFVAVSRRTGAETEDILLGFGAHFDAKIGLLRAITEMTQLLAALQSVNGNAADLDTELASWLAEARVDNNPYLLPGDFPKSELQGFSMIAHDDFRDDVLYCRSLVEKRGMEMLVLDQTRPDIGIPVVKVVVPGLRHFWARFASGRLYDIPVASGWLPMPTTEDDLNPTPLFI